MHSRASACPPAMEPSACREVTGQGPLLHPLRLLCLLCLLCFADLAERARR